ncbi:MAG: hypothetical protein WBW04_03945 [Nitrolancea sp.]
MLKNASGTHRSVVYFPAATPAPQASCADTDGDGVAGLTSFTATYKSKSGTSLLILITPRGEADTAGKYEADLEVRGVGNSPITEPVTLLVP